ncbi:MAG: aminomethyl-transferring glycine dehydrogenase [Bacteroidales bacterium]|nr:aminomethyl-transferring glycine dehydrogenase [Bacteroidales bacterium]
MISNNFTQRHNGVCNAAEEAKMLKEIGVSSIDELIDKAVPAAIRLKEPMPIADGINEYEFLSRCRELAHKNKLYKTYIGMGYYNTITPSVIQRNVFENAGWYTAYTPYQTEISQGRLEALMTYQTMVSEMTGMPLSNASLLDEATSGGECMLMFFAQRSRQAQKDGICKIFVDNGILPQTLDVMRTNAAPRNIEIVTGNVDDFDFDAKQYFAVMIQNPNQFGEVRDYTDFVAKCHENKIFVGMATDLMALAMVKTPGEMGVDCCFGSNQRFGLPMGFGGPHAGFYAFTEDFKRAFPGRIIGWSVDAKGNPALRMALGMREQHIKRDKATSNICTASALQAIMSGFYAAWHGPEGISQIAHHIHKMAAKLAREAEKYGYKQHNRAFFDTLALQCPVKTDVVKKVALAHEINFRYICEECIGISLDETTSKADLQAILNVLAEAAGKKAEELVCDCNCAAEDATLPKNLQRKTSYLTQKVFNAYHSETEMMRYMKKLEVKDLSLNRAMIPLGSCTMKLNAAAEMLPLSWAEFCAVHPFAPEDQTMGYTEMINEMEDMLSIVTGFAGASLQPNSGSAGEYSGLTVIRNYHLDRGDTQRNICLIPASAHGTNPASAAKAGMTVVVVKCNERGDVDVDDLRAKAEQYKDNLACLMITYPSTHGAFEEGILDIINIIHQNGGLVYMDGANMNGQVGLTSPGHMGADVCHLNLHKTFAGPHGGGGSGVGPICVSAKLLDFLPSHGQVHVGGAKGNAMAAAPYGNALLFPISYGYLTMLGGNGLTEATRHAILNANYMRARLQKYYKILYTNKNGMCGHEFIVDFNEFSLKVKVGDIARRLDDYGFHAPTVAFPVHNTLMVEPTESEPLSELDRFCDALIAIRQEIDDVMTGKYAEDNNPIANAPHTMQVVCAEEWNYPYSRKVAAFPMEHEDKYWPTISKIDDAYGDRNLQAVWPE